MKVGEQRGQVGIGTLIVFIAMVLVAAIAAGVLIDTAGFLQSSAQETGSESSKQVSDRVQVVITTGAVGNVTAKVDRGAPSDVAESEEGAITEDVVTSLNVTLTQAPGGSEIDLRNATITYIGPDGTQQLTGVNRTERTNVNPQNGTFGIKPVKDADNSAPVINDPDDRIALVLYFETAAVNTSDSLTQPSDSLEDPASAGFASALSEGEAATIKINTQSGATTTVRVTVPQSLTNTESIEL